MNSRTPRVSVVIPTFNYAQFLPGAIDSVLAQTFRDREVIVVDGGSGDNTREVVSHYGDAIRYIEVPSRFPNVSRNAGISAARGELIAFLDADDIWLPEKLTRQVTLFDANPAVGLVYGGIELFDSASGAVVGYHPLERCHRGQVLRELYEFMFVPSPTPVVRRTVFEAVGPFAKVLGPDDWGMWLRIAAHSELDFVPDVVARYRVHVSHSGRIPVDDYEREMIAFFEEAGSRYPALAPLRRRRISSFVESIGWRQVKEGRTAEGRSRLWRAFRSSPRLSAALHLMASWVMGSMTQGRLARAQGSYEQAKHHLAALRLRPARAAFVDAIRAMPVGDLRPYLGALLTMTGTRFVRRYCERHNLGAYGLTSPAERTHSFGQW